MTTQEQKRALAIARARRRRAEAESQQQEGPSLGTRGEALLRGVGTGALGVGDLAAGVGSSVGNQLRPVFGKERLPGTGFERERARREQLQQEAPFASGAGTVAGALAPVAGVAGLAQRAGLGFRSAQPVSNTLRAAAGGAAAGGVTEANLGGDAGDIAKSAAVGGVASPAAGAALRGAGSVVGAARSLADRNELTGFRALARSLNREGIDENVLAQRFTDFVEKRGRRPSVSELLGKEGGEAVRDTVQAGSRAKRTLQRASERREARAPQDVSDAIRGGRQVVSVSKLEDLRKVAADEAMASLGPRTIRFNPEAVDAIIGNRDIFKALDFDEQAALREIADSGGELTIRQVENARQALAKRASGPGGAPAKFRAFREALVGDATDQVPQYGTYLQAYARRSEGIGGAEEGQRIANATTRDFLRSAETASQPRTGGARVGARGALADAALESPGAAERTARRLADDAGLQQRLSALDPREAARLRDVGETEVRAVEGVRTAAGGRAETALEEGQANLQSALEGIGIAAGRAGPGWVAQFAGRLTQRFRVPPSAALRLAEAVTDPAQAEDALRMLSRAGVEPTAVQRIARDASQAAGRTAGPSTTQEQ